MLVRWNFKIVNRILVVRNSMTMLSESESFERIKVEFLIIFCLEWSSGKRITATINCNAFFRLNFWKRKGFTRFALGKASFVA